FRQQGRFGHEGRGRLLPKLTEPTLFVDLLLPVEGSDESDDPADQGGEDQTADNSRPHPLPPAPVATGAVEERRFQLSVPKSVRLEDVLLLVGGVVEGFRKLGVGVSRRAWRGGGGHR